MNTRSIAVSAYAVIAAAILGCGAQRAEALSGQSIPIDIRQDQFTAYVFLGHMIFANSNMNRLMAGGTYDARCPSPETAWPITGQNSRTDESLLWGTSVTVGVPEPLPARKYMPGFENVPGGTTLRCTYQWTMTVQEGTLTVGIPGLGFTMGGGSINTGGPINFDMYQPGISGGSEADHGCLP